MMKPSLFNDPNALNYKSQLDPSLQPPPVPPQLNPPMMFAQPSAPSPTPAPKEKSTMEEDMSSENPPTQQSKAKKNESSFYELLQRMGG